MICSEQGCVEPAHARLVWVSRTTHLEVEQGKPLCHGHYDRAVVAYEADPPTELFLLVTGP